MQLFALFNIIRLLNWNLKTEERGSACAVCSNVESWAVTYSKTQVVQVINVFHLSFCKSSLVVSDKTLDYNLLMVTEQQQMCQRSPHCY